MEQSINKPVKVRRTTAQIYALLDEFEKSNVGIPAFCATHNICKATFHKWCSRYKTKPEKHSKATGFTTLQITDERSTGTALLFAEVRGIKIYQPVVAAYLKELSSL